MKVFTWKVSQGTLLTKSNLAKKEVRLKLECAACNGAMETEGHVFRECSFVRAMWVASSLGLRSLSLFGISICKWLQSMVEHQGNDF